MFPRYNGKIKKRQIIFRNQLEGCITSAASSSSLKEIFSYINYPNILVWGKICSINIPKVRIWQVLGRLLLAGVPTQQLKCRWLQSCVTFWSHQMDVVGLHRTWECIEAISHIPRPTNRSELRTFLGSITYFGHFIQKLHFICF